MLKFMTFKKKSPALFYKELEKINSQKVTPIKDEILFYSNLQRRGFCIPQRNLLKETNLQF